MSALKAAPLVIPDVLSFDYEQLWKDISKDTVNKLFGIAMFIDSGFEDLKNGLKKEISSADDLLANPTCSKSILQLNRLFERFAELAEAMNQHFNLDLLFLKAKFQEKSFNDIRDEVRNLTAQLFDALKNKDQQKLQQIKSKLDEFSKLSPIASLILSRLNAAIASEDVGNAGKEITFDTITQIRQFADFKNLLDVLKLKLLIGAQKTLAAITKLLKSCSSEVKDAEKTIADEALKRQLDEVQSLDF